MGATTVKLEDALLREIRAVKPQGQTLAAYVREAVERDILHRKLRSSAEQYQVFLSKHPEEKAELDSWERAPLTAKPVKARR
jgi:hypothetical protein